MPDVALDPLHWVEPDAVQDVALVVDQEKVDVLFNSTETGDAVKLIVGAGLGGGVLLPPPPPPPPPQATRLSVASAIGMNLIRTYRPNVCHNLLDSAFVTQTEICTLLKSATANN